MDLNALIFASFSVAFLISVIDYWVDLGIYRAAAALGIAMASAIPFQLPWWSGLMLALASSFLAMFLLQVVERINFKVARR